MSLALLVLLGIVGGGFGYSWTESDKKIKKRVEDEKALVDQADYIVTWTSARWAVSRVVVPEVSGFFVSYSYRPIKVLPGVVLIRTAEGHLRLPAALETSWQDHGSAEQLERELNGHVEARNPVEPTLLRGIDDRLDVKLHSGTTVPARYTNGGNARRRIGCAF